MLKTEGPAGFYKGIGAPLLSVPFINAIIFASYEINKKFMRVVLKKERLGAFESSDI